MVERWRKGHTGARKRAQLSQLVIESLQFLKEHTGWTTRAVAGFIRREPRASALAAAAGCRKNNLGRRVASVLKRGVRMGLLKCSGTRYRLSRSPPASRYHRCHHHRSHSRHHHHRRRR